MALVGQAARETGLLAALDGLTPCKQRDRSASDQENVMALIGSRAAGRGKLRDLDDLREDDVAQRALGLDRAAGSRRMGEWLSRVKKRHVDALLVIGHGVAKQVAPAIVEAEQATRGYVPVFWDSAMIEVKGKQFKHAKRTYGGMRKLWMRGLFVGRLQVGGRLAPGHEDAVGAWRKQMTEELDPLLPPDAKV